MLYLSQKVYDLVGKNVTLVFVNLLNAQHVESLTHKARLALFLPCVEYH